MKAGIYLNLDGEAIEKTKNQAKKRALEDGNEKCMKYPNITLAIDCIEFDEKDGNLTICGDMIDDSSEKNLGYVSVDFFPDLDLVISLIQHYMKKLGKLKTVLEATK